MKGAKRRGGPRREGSRECASTRKDLRGRSATASTPRREKEDEKGGLFPLPGTTRNRNGFSVALLLTGGPGPVVPRHGIKGPVRVEARRVGVQVELHLDPIFDLDETEGLRRRLNPEVGHAEGMAAADPKSLLAERAAGKVDATQSLLAGDRERAEDLDLTPLRPSGDRVPHRRMHQFELNGGMLLHLERLLQVARHARVATVEGPHRDAHHGGLLLAPAGAVPARRQCVFGRRKRGLPLDPIDDTGKLVGGGLSLNPESAVQVSANVGKISSIIALRDAPQLLGDRSTRLKLEPVEGCRVLGRSLKRGPPGLADRTGVLDRAFHGRLGNRGQRKRSSNQEADK